MADWTAKQRVDVLGSEKAQSPTTWPPAARGLPLSERKRLRKIGLHRLDTQLAMAMVNLLAAGHVTDETYCDWLVQGFEFRAWRGADQRMMKIAHGYRASGGAIRLQGRVESLGPICMGIPMALKGDLDIEDLLRKTMHATDIFYQSPETSLAAACVAFGVHQVMHDKRWHVPDAEIRAVIDDHFLETASLDRLFAEHEGGLKLSQLESQVRRILNVLALTVDYEGEGVESLECLSETTLKAPESTIAAAVLSARTGIVPKANIRLMDEDRIERYAGVMRREYSPIEDAVTFFKNEYELSRAERVFQDNMAAERRS
jgi:hypothetical protein